jgi:hypothetical protein
MFAHASDYESPQAVCKALRILDAGLRKGGFAIRLARYFVTSE